MTGTWPQSAPGSFFFSLVRMTQELCQSYAYILRVFSHLINLIISCSREQNPNKLSMQTKRNAQLFSYLNKTCFIIRHLFLNLPTYDMTYYLLSTQGNRLANIHIYCFTKFSSHTISWNLKQNISTNKNTFFSLEYFIKPIQIKCQTRSQSGVRFKITANCLEKN